MALRIFPRVFKSKIGQYAPGAEQLNFPGLQRTIILTYFHYYKQWPRLTNAKKTWKIMLLKNFCEELNLIQQNIWIRLTKVVNTRIQDWRKEGEDGETEVGEGS